MSKVLAEPQKRAWVAVLLSYTAAHRVIDATLKAESFPGLEVYDVLLALEDAPGRVMRMVDLADTVIYSPSGLTRLIDRMEAAGYVARKACPGDRRAIHIVLTAAGLRAREGAWPRYAELIQKHFGKYLSDAESVQIAAGLGKVMEGERTRRRFPSA